MWPMWCSMTSYAKVISENLQACSECSYWHLWSLLECWTHRYGEMRKYAEIYGIDGCSVHGYVCLYLVSHSVSIELTRLAIEEMEQPWKSVSSLTQEYVELGCIKFWHLQNTFFACHLNIPTGSALYQGPKVFPLGSYILAKSGFLTLINKAKWYLIFFLKSP